MLAGRPIHGLLRQPPCCIRAQSQPAVFIHKNKLALLRWNGVPDLICPAVKAVFDDLRSRSLRCRGDIENLTGGPSGNLVAVVSEADQSPLPVGAVAERQSGADIGKSVKVTVAEVCLAAEYGSPDDIRSHAFWGEGYA